jgi:hypothetical protein
MRIACIVPSCREAQLSAFVEAWRPELAAADVRLYVVEDAPARSFRLDAAVTHLCWADAPPGMLDCISVRSPGCRQIGFWRAHEDGADVVVTLDDDVRPIAGERVFERFAEILAGGLPVWVDPMLNYRSRGYPTGNVGRLQTDFHVGTFFGVPDVDGETQLAQQAEFAARPPQYVERPTIVPAGQLLPVNGGICGWRRELTPYVHYTVWDPDLDYRRFDDIWMGIVLKLALDLSGRRLSCGPPGVLHERASDARRNAELERSAKAWNERFWEALAAAVARRAPSGPIDLDAAWHVVADALEQIGNAWAEREAAAMRRWRMFF